MSATKPAPVPSPTPVHDGDDEFELLLENAPIDPDALTTEELAEVEACLADEPSAGRSTLEVLDGIVARAKRER